jgi:ribosome modulation factor
MSKKRIDRITRMGYDAYMTGDFKSYVQVTLFASRRTRRAFTDGWRRAEHKIITSATYGKV